MLKWYAMDKEAGADAGGAAGGAAAPAGTVLDPKGEAGKGAAPGGDGKAAAASAGDDGKGKSATPAPDWPDDWRAKITTDEKLLKRLERYASPKAVAEALLTVQQDIGAGKLKSATAFPDKGTDAEKAAWRTENGVPESPAKYELKFENGLVVGEADKPIIDKFLETAHASNMPPGQAKAAVEWFFKNREERQAAALEAFEQQKVATASTLRAEWGDSYARNNNVIGSLLDAHIPAEETELKTLIKRAVETNPKYARFMAAIGLEVNPLATVAPGTGASQVSAIEDRIVAIEKLMRAAPGSVERKQYNDPKISGVDGEYSRLLAARDKLKDRK